MTTAIRPNDKGKVREHYDRRSPHLPFAVGRAYSSWLVDSRR